MQGYHDHNGTYEAEPQFKVDVDMLRCQSCFTVVSNIVQTVCGHRYCEDCLNSHLPDDGSLVKCPVEEDYCEMISKGDTVIGTRVDVLSLPVYCLYSSYGCVANISWGCYLEHIQSCTHKRLKCPNRTNGCPELLKEHQIESHLKRCRYKHSSCKYCNQEHVHSVGCPLAVVSCSFQQVGCRFVGTSEDLKEHLKTHIGQHLEMLSECVIKLKIQLQTVLDGRVIELAVENNVLKDKLAELQASISDKDILAHKVHMLAFENRILEDKLQGAAVVEYEQRLRSCRHPQTFPSGQNVHKYHMEHGEISEKLLRRISKKISTDQEMSDLGIHLGFPFESIKAVRTDCQTSINQAALNMLYYWFKYFDGTTQEALAKLKEALIDVGLTTIAEEFHL